MSYQSVDVAEVVVVVDLEDSSIDGLECGVFLEAFAKVFPGFFGLSSGPSVNGVDHFLAFQFGLSARI